ncbi:MAG: VOC family protein [Burkholderiales bacterium]|nr:VOC family protein [Burkholderiales bacterium]
MSTEVDHLVVAAATLDEGVRWCEATLGLTPAAGGRHEFMGTHNRVLALSSPAFPRCYLEIIAVDPQAAPLQRLRWFALDDPAQQARLRAEGPRLIHVVVRTHEMETHHWGLLNKGLNPGPVIEGQRDSEHGALAWRITVRDDGRLLAGGVLPTLIRWDSRHPADHLPDQGARLLSLRLDGLPAAARDLLRLQGVTVDSAAAPRIVAVVATPRGEVTLAS